MKYSRPRIRIEKTLIPKATLDQQLFRVADMNYFYKIKGNVKLLQLANLQKQSRRTGQQSSYGKRFNISKRPNFNKTQTARASSYSIPNITRRIVRKSKDEVSLLYDQQISNINKTISGTPLGALSGLHIIEGLENQIQKHSSEFQGFGKIKRIDSDFNQQGTERQNIPQIKPKAKSNNQHNRISASRQSDKLFQSIYNGQDDFAQKHKEYHMMLMERIPTFKSRHLTLDYKNQWRL